MASSLSREYETQPIPRFSRATKLLAASALGLSLFLGDTFEAQFEASLTRPTILQVTSPQHKANLDSAINISPGLGLRNSYAIADTLRGFSSEGRVWATAYDNKAINGGNIAELLLKKSEADGVTHLALWGDSMGGTLSLEMAVDIQRSKQDINVPYIVLEDTPSSLEAVRQQQQVNGDLLLSSTETPLLAYSRVAHFLVELGARYEQYANDDGFEAVSFASAAGTVFDTKIAAKDAPSSALMGSQYSTIVTSNVRNNIIELGKPNESGKPKPVLVLIRPVSDTSDQVVDSDVMEAEYRAYAFEAKLHLVVVEMPDISHGDPTMNQQQYRDIIPTIIAQVEAIKQRPLIPSEAPYRIGHVAGR